ncbi:MAG: exo-alpha-sialidase, partial [Lentisphaerae bacterium]|nr:exo-alpha-sialidase [Lentisphaerota bacterium]
MDELDYSVEPRIIHRGYDRKTCWVQTRSAVIPPNTAVVTTQKLRITGSDIFYGINDLWSADFGRTW